MKRLAGLIGWAATYQLLTIYGGKRIRLPSRSSYDGVLVLAIGSAACAALAESDLAGKLLHVPMLKKLIAQVRDQEIRQSRATAWELAQRWNVTTRWVYHVRGAARDSSSQLCLV